MEVILLQDMDTLGIMFDKVKVKDGYGRNFLIPQKKAIEINTINSKKVIELQKQREKRESLLLASIQEVTAKLTAQAIQLTVKSGTSGKIFGNVTTLQIARAIKEQTGYEIDRKKIVLPGDIREVGAHTATIQFMKDSQATIQLQILASE